jgi:hypothetical protein
MTWNSRLERSVTSTSAKWANVSPLRARSSEHFVTVVSSRSL